MGRARHEMPGYQTAKLFPKTTMIAFAGIAFDTGAIGSIRKTLQETPAHRKPKDDIEEQIRVTSRVPPYQPEAVAPGAAVKVGSFS